MKILAIGTSSSKQSINRALATYAAGLVADAKVETVDINDYEMPLFSSDRETTLGSPPEARDFYRIIGEADALVLAFAEHNGTYTAAWKNLFDWTSRIDQKVFQDKPAVYLSTSPGARGAASVLAEAVNSAPFFGAEVVASQSLPRFNQVFDMEAGELKPGQARETLEQAMTALEQRVLLQVA